MPLFKCVDSFITLRMARNIFDNWWIGVTVSIAEDERLILAKLNKYLKDLDHLLLPSNSSDVAS